MGDPPLSEMGARGDFMVKSFRVPQVKIKDLESCVHRVALKRGINPRISKVLFLLREARGV